MKAAMQKTKTGALFKADKNIQNKSEYSIKV